MIHAVVNPAGAGGRTMKTWLKAEEILQAKGCEYDVHYSSLKYNINDIVHDLSSQNTETDLLILGGDGTMNLTVNSIADFEKTRIALLPCGSGNDLAKALSIPKDPEACIEQLLKNEIVRELDIGEAILHNRYDDNGVLKSAEDVTKRFNISAGIGFDAEICAFVENSDTKKKLNKVHLGKMSYIAAAMKVIFEAKHSACEMILDDEQTIHFDELLFTAAMNTAYEGGGFKFAPDADPKDGLLDLCTADHLGRFDFFRMFPYAYTGSHVKFDGVFMNRAKKAEIKTERPFWIHTDGEIHGLSSHITFQISGQKLRMLV